MARQTVPTEYQECQAFHQWLQAKHLKHTHIGNESQMGGRAGAIRGARLKSIGQSKGFPDYLVLVNNRLIAIEMKRQKGGRLSKEQKEWLEALRACGIQSFPAQGAEQAIDIVSLFLR